MASPRATSSWTWHRRSTSSSACVAVRAVLDVDQWLRPASLDRPARRVTRRLVRSAKRRSRLGLARPGRISSSRTKVRADSCKVHPTLSTVVGSDRVGRHIDTDDVIDAHGMAALLGLSQRNTVSLYQRRYPLMPKPVIDLGRGRCKLWLRSEIEDWRSKDRPQPDPA